MSSGLPYSIFPLGDAAISIDFGNRIDRSINDQVMTLYHYLHTQSLHGISDIVPAYSSLTIHYDFDAWLPEISKGRSVFGIIKEILVSAVEACPAGTIFPARTVRIPVCYEGNLAPDLADVAASAGVDRDEVVTIHTSGSYHVYMLGFLPGFAYMGEVDETIATSRKQRPQTILAGSVGIAGRQTGIYPMDSPGGWQIIGRTPLIMFTQTTGETLLKPGDRVQFYSISSNEFKNY